MPSHLHDGADPDIPPRALRAREHEPDLIRDLICPGPAPAGSSEGTGRIVARGHGSAPLGDPKYARAADADEPPASVAAATNPR